MNRPDADPRQDPAGREQELPQQAGERRDAPRPDQVRTRGNPEIEEIDVDRGLDKIERVSGN